MTLATARNRTLHCRSPTHDAPLTIGPRDRGPTLARMQADPAVATLGRIDGLDLARLGAMVGMLIAHYGGQGPGPNELRWVRHFVDGRAMPLFVLLGGAGITLLTDRCAHPDRRLALRALVLLGLGLLLNEHVPFVAVIIHYYAAYFLAGIALRRLGDRLLLAVAVLVTLVGAVTYQVIAPTATTFSGWGAGTAVRPWPLVTELSVAGYYPLLPSLAFVCVGMWLARQRLDQRRCLLSIGLTGVALYVAGYGLGALADATIDPPRIVVDSAGQATIGPAVVDNLAEHGVAARGLERAAARNARQQDIAQVEALDDVLDSLPKWTTEPDGFTLSRVLDGSGHSEMPAWVMGATGFAVLVVALACSLTIALSRHHAAAGVLRWLAGLGRFSLTFYVVHTLLLRLVADDFYAQPLIGNFLLMGWVFGGFVVAASLWQLRFRRGPLEAVLRLVDGPARRGRAL